MRLQHGLQPVRAGEPGLGFGQSRELGGNAAESAEVLVVGQFIAKQLQRDVDQDRIVEQTNDRFLVGDQVVAIIAVGLYDRDLSPHLVASRPCLVGGHAFEPFHRRHARCHERRRSAVGMVGQCALAGGGHLVQGHPRRIRAQFAQGEVEALQSAGLQFATADAGAPDL